MVRSSIAHRLRRIAMVSPVATLAAWAVAASAWGADIFALAPDEVQWTQRRSAPDVFYAGIYNEPGTAGAYAFRVRAQAGHSLPPHTHPDERTITVLRGTYWAGVGEVFDRDRLVPYPAGSFYVIPAGLPHFSAVVEGEVEFQEAGVGPSRHDVTDAPSR